MYTSKKLERLKAIPQWTLLVCVIAAIVLFILYILGYHAYVYLAVLFTFAGWVAGYNEAHSWCERVEEERQLWWQHRYLREQAEIDSRGSEDEITENPENLDNTPPQPYVFEPDSFGGPVEELRERIQERMLTENVKKEEEYRNKCLQTYSRRTNNGRSKYD